MPPLSLPPTPLSLLLVTAEHPTDEGLAGTHPFSVRTPCLRLLLWPVVPRRATEGRGRAAKGTVTGSIDAPRAMAELIDFSDLHLSNRHRRTRRPCSSRGEGAGRTLGSWSQQGVGRMGHLDPTATLHLDLTAIGIWRPYLQPSTMAFRSGTWPLSKLGQIRSRVMRRKIGEGIHGTIGIQEIGQYIQLWIILQGTILMDAQDQLQWKWTSDGTYSVRSCYLATFHGSTSFYSRKLIWKSWAPPKVKFFHWLAHLDRCWTAAPASSSMPALRPSPQNDPEPPPRLPHCPPSLAKDP